MKNKNETTKGFHRWAGFMTYYHMVGGLIGLLITFLLLRKLPISGDTWVLFIIQTILFCFTFYCGYAFMNKDYKRAVRLSLYANILQVIPFAIGGIGYTFVSGLGATLKYSLIEASALKMEFDISSFALGSGNNADDFIGINFIAILVVFALFTMHAENKRS